MVISARYRPAVAAADAREWTGDNFDEIVNFIHSLPTPMRTLYVDRRHLGRQLWLYSDDCVEHLELGDWIVYIGGEFLACPRRLFSCAFELIAVNAQLVEEND